MSNIVLRALPQEYRKITVNGYMASEIVLKSCFKLFEGIEENAIELVMLDKYGLNLLKLAHGDIKSLIIENDLEVIKYIHMANYLGANSTLNKVLINNFKYDNLLLIFQYWHIINFNMEFEIYQQLLTDRAKYQFVDLEPYLADKSFEFNFIVRSIFKIDLTAFQVNSKSLTYNYEYSGVNAIENLHYRKQLETCYE